MPRHSHDHPSIAILNGNADILESVRQALEDDGFRVATALLAEIKRGKDDLVDFLEKNDPIVVFYDVPPPYEENMTFLRLIKDMRSLDNRCIVLTTTNKKALEKVTGETEAIEIMGKPYDLDELIKLARQKVKACRKSAA
jgi:DNA-binding NtrC family response regulator